MYTNLQISTNPGSPLCIEIFFENYFNYYAKLNLYNFSFLYCYFNKTFNEELVVNRGPSDDSQLFLVPFLALKKLA